MNKSVKTLIFIIVAMATITVSALTTFAADTPEKRLSRLLLGGEYPVTNGYQPNRIHAGVDFGSVGDGVTSVKSPVSGTIIANTEACGKVAIYDGRNTIILAHMKNRTSLAVGKTIAVGDYVGKASKVVGGGCRATGAHLHIEVRTGRNTSMALPTNDNRNTTLNPITYLVGSTAMLEMYDLQKNDYAQTFFELNGTGKYNAEYLPISLANKSYLLWLTIPNQTAKTINLVFG